MALHSGMIWCMMGGMNHGGVVCAAKAAWQINIPAIIAWFALKNKTHGRLRLWVYSFVKEISGWVGWS
jgi:hypothetical protein